MSFSRWLSQFLAGSQSKRRPLRRPINPLSGLHDWLLEDRCLLSSGIPFPTNTPGIDSIGQVMYNGVTGTDQKTITITNNSDQTIYAFLEGENSLTSLTQPKYAATAVYDPYDPANHEYRGYVGYTENGTTNAGLPAHSSITITNVPMAFWDSGRIIFSTDGDDQFNTTNNTFNYAATNDQAQYYLNTNGSNNTNQLYFTSVYNSFGADGMPTNVTWTSPVDTTGTNQPGTLQPGTYFINGPGIPADTIATVSAANPTYVTLSNHVQNLSGQDNRYVFNAAGQPTKTSSTLHFIQMGYTLTNINDNSSTSDGDVMWYQALGALNPTNESPYQLAESTFRSTSYNTPGYQALMLGSQFSDAKSNEADYDISFVDAANMPIALEAPDVPITVNVNGSPVVTQAPFGWAGSDKSVQDFQNALQAFTSVNANGNNSNGLGWYFGGQGYPAYPTVQAGNIKLPSGYNLFNGPTPLSGSAYASQAIETVWYSWAKYYVDNINQLAPKPPTQAVTGTISNGNVLTLDNPSLANGLLPGMVVTSPQNPNWKVFILYIGQNDEIHLSETVSGITQFQFSNPDLNSIWVHSQKVVR